jgi:hypothetical protein
MGQVFVAAYPGVYHYQRNAVQGERGADGSAADCPPSFPDPQPSASGFSFEKLLSQQVHSRIAQRWNDLFNEIDSPRVAGNSGRKSTDGCRKCQAVPACPADGNEVCFPPDIDLEIRSSAHAVIQVFQSHHQCGRTAREVVMLAVKWDIQVD